MARFLILTHISPPAIDGGSKVIHKMGDYFQRHGHHVIRLSSNCSSTDDFTRKHRPLTPTAPTITLPVYSIFHRPFRLLKKILFIIHKSYFMNLLLILQKGPIFKFFPFIKSLIVVLKFHPDYIIAGPLPTTIILYTRVIQKLTRAKVIFNASFHPTDPEFQNPIIFNLLKSFDYLWTLTKYETNYFKRLLFTNVVLLGNGVDSNFIINPTKVTFPKKPTLLFIGSFSAHKGLDQIINLSLQFPDISFIIAGQPTLYSQKIKLNYPNVKTIIKPTDAQIKRLLDNCTALILPSLQESFGLVLIEAMARGKPILVSNIPSLQELVRQSQSGLTISHQNVQRIINQPQQFGLNGHQYVRQYCTWDKIGDKLWQELSS